MPTVAVVAALGSAACWAVGSLLFERRLSRSRDASANHGERAGASTDPASLSAPLPSAAAANLFKNVLAGLCFLILFWATSAALPHESAWPWLLASGAFGFALGDTLYFAALPRAGVQVAALVGLVHVPAAVGLEALASGDVPPLATLGAMVVILAGVALVLCDAPRAELGSVEADARRRRTRAGVAFAALGAVAQAVGVVVGHRGMDGTSLFGGTLARLVGGIVGAFVVAFVVGLLRRRVASEVSTLVAPFGRPRSARPLFVAAMFGSVIGLPLFHVGLRDLPSGVAAVLFATTPLFTLPLSAWNGARVTWRSVLGTVLGFAGVAGVTWSLAHAA